MKTPTMDDMLLGGGLVSGAFKERTHPTRYFRHPTVCVTACGVGENFAGEQEKLDVRKML